MFCSQCGNDIADGWAVCPSCGTRLTGETSRPGVPAAATAGAHRAAVNRTAPVYSFDARRWTRSDQIVGGATLVALISLFLPWFSVSLSGPLGGGSATASGTTAHGWLWFVFVIGLVILAYLVLVAGYEQLPFRLPWPPERLLLAASGLNLLLVLLAFVLKPSSGFTDLKVGWDFGAFIALLAAIAAVAPLAQAARNARGSAQA
jgi:zinc-ribbon domain